ncbi:MAG: translation elongation factor Ts [Clostridiales Family XIII bacterium]|jgi:elongation factor Ts|nr:translation elongation factor Ts [Clostridiales Family XIII bacterium]
MAVTAAMVKELRERTGAGMMDCKNVLIETDGDMERSIEVLREKGLAKAAKKAGRIASEGLVRIRFSQDCGTAAIVEVNSETDFVAKNEDFVAFVEAVSTLAAEASWSEPAELLALPYDDAETTVKDKLNGLIATIGENLNIRRAEKLGSPGVVYIGYTHGGGKIGVVIGLETTAPYEDVSVVGKDIAMQVASMSPKFIDESQVDPAYIEAERKILLGQALNEGKPAAIVEKMVAGRLKKELKESCLLEQKFVKNPDITVAQYIDAAEEALQTPLKVVEMVRYEVGEGIEKREENFAEEVAKQIGG